MLADVLLTGPATNFTTFGVLAKLHGARVAFVFALSMWAGAVVLGYAANWLMPTPNVPALFGEGHGHSTLGWVLLVALGVVFLLSLLRQGVRPFLERLFESPANLAHGEAPGCCGPGEDHHHHHHHHHHAPAAAEGSFTPTTRAPLAPPRLPTP